MFALLYSLLLHEPTEYFLFREGFLMEPAVIYHLVNSAQTIKQISGQHQGILRSIERCSGVFQLLQGVVYRSNQFQCAHAWRCCGP